MGEHYIIEGNGREMRKKVLDAIQDHATLVFTVHALGKAIDESRDVTFLPARLSWAKLESTEVQDSVMVVTGSVQVGEQESRAIVSLSSTEDIPSDLEILDSQDL